MCRTFNLDRTRQNNLRERLVCVLGRDGLLYIDGLVVIYVLRSITSKPTLVVIRSQNSNVTTIEMNNKSCQ